MNRDYGFIISIILFGISIWLDYTYNNKLFNVLVIIIGIIVIYETATLGYPNTKETKKFN